MPGRVGIMFGESVAGLYNGWRAAKSGKRFDGIMNSNGGGIPRRMADLTADIARSLGFFSRLPIGSADNLPNFARAARVLPLVGTVIALPAALLVLALSATGLPPLVVAATATTLLVATTGALHEDGLADVADGFGGGFGKARKLEIMRDSRIGAYGVIALVLALLVRVAALAALIEGTGATAAAAALMIAAGVSRTLMGWLWHALPPVRSDGKSAAAGQPSQDAMCVASAIALVLIILAAFRFGTAPALVAVAASSIAVALLGLLARRQIGGQTGDVLGASQQIAELVFLVGLLM